MSRLLEASALALVIGAPALAHADTLGRLALPEEVAAWDIDIRPDGAGLPEGRGDVWTGEELYELQCAHCHGTFGEGIGAWPVVAGGFGTLTHEHPEKTIGSYWPYLSTVFDYVYRAMPYGFAQSLEPDEVYAITAYLLYLNDLVDDDFELSAENFTEIRLPNEDGFYMDDRVETEWPSFTQDPCMTDCGDAVAVSMRAAVLEVTPDDPLTEARHAQYLAMAAASGGDAGDAGPPAAAEEAAAPEEEEEAAAGYTPEQVAAGEAAWRQCRTCHNVGDGARHAVGPHLNGVYGAPVGAQEGFRYSPVLTEAGADGMVWDNATLDAFLENPRAHLPRNRMSFNGVRDADERQGLIAYIASFGE